MEGIVKFFNDKRGFGFITVEETGKDVFVHYTGILGEGHRTLKDGQRVTFDEEIDPKNGKPRAINVKWLIWRH